MQTSVVGMTSQLRYGADIVQDVRADSSASSFVNPGFAASSQRRVLIPFVTLTIRSGYSVCKRAEDGLAHQLGM